MTAVSTVEVSVNGETFNLSLTKMSYQILVKQQWFTINLMQSGLKQSNYWHNMGILKTDSSVLKMTGSNEDENRCIGSLPDIYTQDKS